MILSIKVTRMWIKPIVVLFFPVNSSLLLPFFFSFEATSEDKAGRTMKLHSQICSQKGVLLLFHLMFIILPHQIKKNQILLIE